MSVVVYVSYWNTHLARNWNWEKRDLHKTSVRTHTKNYYLVKRREKQKKTTHKHTHMQTDWMPNSASKREKSDNGDDNKNDDNIHSNSDSDHSNISFC